MKAINQKRVAINVSIKFWLITFYQRRFRCNLNLSFSFKKIVNPSKTGIMTLQRNVVEDS